MTIRLVEATTLPHRLVKATILLFYQASKSGMHDRDLQLRSFTFHARVVTNICGSYLV